MIQSLRIALLTDGEPFHGASPEKTALGGSETALVQVARALADRGHRVEVFCRCPAPGWYQGVVYHDTAALVKAALEKRWDVLIVSRFFSAFDLPLQAGLKILWNHDILDKPEELAKRLDNIDLMLLLSRFHAHDYVNKLPQCAAKIRNTVNGLDLDLIDEAAAGSSIEPGKVTYVSRPERGLKLLLGEIWPELKKRHPHLNLHICGYEVNATDIAPSLQKLYAEINDMIKQGQDVHYLGALPKREYYAHLASCEFLLYPCTFPEISCISALEAQAVGTPVITSDAFALSQTVKSVDFLVQGKPGSPEYVQDFIDRVSRFIINPQKTAKIAARVRRDVRNEHQWSNIVRRWEDMFINTLSDRCRNHPEGIAASLVINGDRLAAANLLGHEAADLNEPAPPPDPKEEALLSAMHDMIMSANTAIGTIGVVSLDNGRTTKSLDALLPDCSVNDLNPENCDGSLDLVVVRDLLERQHDPAKFLTKIMRSCAPHGRVLLCVASGAWPLLSTGHAGRLYDLDGEDLSELLTNLDFELRHVPQGLVRMGDLAYSAGRWLAMVRTGKINPSKTDPNSKLFRVRPAPEEVEQEVRSARLL